MANVPRLSKILRGKDTKPLTELEAAIKYALDHAGGGDKYETVAEIAVGTMEREGGDQFVWTGSPISLNVQESDELYLDTVIDKFPLDVTVESSGALLKYNYTEVPTGTPFFAIGSGEEAVSILTDTAEIENTTIRILKKISGGDPITVDSELSDTSGNPVQNKAISEALTYLAENKANKGDLPLVIRGNTSGTSVTIDTEIKDIYNAAEDGRVVMLDTNIGQNMIRFNLYGRGYDETNDEYSCGFSMLSPDPGAAAVMRVTFEQSSKTGTLTMHGIAYV